MNDPDTAAQDPIFWLHHSNIDRLWAVWVRNGHSNPTTPGWLNQQFSFFDENGQPVTMTAVQVLDTVADLGYTYDQLVAPGAPPAVPAPRRKDQAGSNTAASPDALQPDGRHPRASKPRALPR